MFVIAWRFTTNDRATFERHYAPDGTWAQLFRRAAGYVRTDLLTDGTAYITLDWWTSRAAYATFRHDYAADYARIDRECESLTTSEESLGQFEEVARTFQSPLPAVERGEG